MMLHLCRLTATSTIENVVWTCTPDLPRQLLAVECPLCLTQRTSGEYRSEVHCDEFQHLAEGTEVARRRRRLFFVLQLTLSFRTHHNLCRQGMALAGTRQLCSQDPMSVHEHCTEGVTGSEGEEGANGVGGSIGVETDTET